MNGLRIISCVALLCVMLSLAGEAWSAEEASTRPAPAVKVQPYGRWNLTVDMGGRQRPSWLAIENRDNQTVGRFLGTGGGVGDIGPVKIDGAKVTFNAHGLKWTGTIDGDTMSGTRVNDKDEPQGKWTGKRAVYTVDLTGTWYLKKTGLPIQQPDVLTLKQEGNTISGTLTEGDETVAIIDAQVMRNMLLKFVAPMKSGTRRYTGSIRGDVLDFLAIADRARFRAIAHRQREWGEPIELFNGKDLSQWEPLGDPEKFQWKVIDGVMVNTGEGGAANIVSKQSFRDFKMHVAFSTPEHGNSGVYLRGRHEIQVADSVGKVPAWGDCGALYSRIAPAVNASKKAGEWQTFDITLVGQYLTVVYNGQVIIDNAEVEGITGGAIDSKEFEPGPFYLQGDHGPISYRKIIVWPSK